MNGEWRKPTLHLASESHWLLYTMELTVKIGLIRFRFCPTTTNVCGQFHMERQLREFAVQTTVKSQLSLSVSTMICANQRCSISFLIVLNPSVAENGLSGEIPSALQMLTHMSMLWLNGNEISGSLPSQLGTLRYLSRLDLSDNAMRGTIPSEIGNLRYLEDINLGVNIFSGTIPSTLSNLPKLKTVWMDRNILAGNVTSVCAAHPSILISADCEEVVCPCCAFCCDASGVCGGST